MNAGLPRASDKTGMTPTPSLITGMASLTATIAPLSPTRMAAMVSRESEIAFVSLQERPLVFRYCSVHEGPETVKIVTNCQPVSKGRSHSAPPRAMGLP